MAQVPLQAPSTVGIPPTQASVAWHWGSSRGDIQATAREGGERIRWHSFGRLGAAELYKLVLPPHVHHAVGWVEELAGGSNLLQRATAVAFQQGM